MPIFEYSCGNCNNQFELMFLVADKPEEKCPLCGGHDVVRAISTPIIRVHGRSSLRNTPDPTMPLQRLKEHGPTLPGCEGGYKELPEVEKIERKGKDKSGNTMWDRKTPPVTVDMGQKT